MDKKTYYKYDIALKPLTHEYIELVREWRNDHKIKQYARHQQYITQSDQEQWWRDKDNDENLYFLVEIDNLHVGLIWANNLKDRVETGFYIYDDKYQDGIFSYKVVTLFHEILFHEYKLEHIYCNIMDSNKRAIRFNTSLGYENIIYEGYVLTKEKFIKASKKIKPIIQEQSIM